MSQENWQSFSKMNWNDFPLEKQKISTKESDLAIYGKDWTHQYKIKAKAVVFPSSTQDVQKVILWARKNKISLVPSGGRTGLSGGACATKNEVVVSMGKMNQITHWDPISQIVTCESGVITEELQNFVKEKDYYLPIDFSAKASSQIGGNIATNVGGIKVIKYGMLRNWVAGIEVVTGSGDILHMDSNLIKNATGYDLKQLFIGSEGTLGIITKCSLFVTKPPQETLTLLASTPTVEGLFEVYKLFKRKFHLTSFEMFSENAISYVCKNKPFPIKPSKYILIFQTEKKQDLLMECFEECFGKGWLEDGTISQNSQQEKDLWSYRENISESLSSYKPYKNDISVLPSKIGLFVEEMSALIKKSYENFKVVWFGHIGDGNLHINVLKPEEISEENFYKKYSVLNELLFEVVKKYKGSISAEHGVGLVKKKDLHYSREKEEILFMKQIKKTFDPDGILNQGKIFD